MRDKWVIAMATIVESLDAPPGATGPTWGRARDYHDYLVEVGAPNGQALRAHVGMQSMFVHAVGEPLPVEVNFKTGQVRIDKVRMAEMLRQQGSRFGEAMRAGRSAAAPGGVARPAGGAEERLARLAELRDKGLVTESEYQAKREQIISEI